jgi:hypothetical protein
MISHVASVKNQESVCNFGWKKLSRRLKDKWETSIMINLSEIWCKGMNYVYLAQNRVQCKAFVTMIMKLWIP